MFECKNGWDETEMSYKFVCDMIESIDDSFDNQIRCVFETKLYQKHLSDSGQQPQENETKRKNVSNIIAPFLFKALNNPFFDTDEVKSISQSTGLTERQVRDFFRNQRKRKIQYLNKLHEDEKENIEAKISYLYHFIDLAINEYLNIGQVEPEAGIGDFLCFPSEIK